MSALTLEPSDGMGGVRPTSGGSAMNPPAEPQGGGDDTTQEDVAATRGSRTWPESNRVQPSIHPARIAERTARARDR
jgi:ribosomal protein L2